jgi:hypothetical protein
MQDQFAHVFAEVIATTYATRPLELSILGLVEIETGREPFEPLLERLARRSDIVGDAARAVLARWYGS